jgi:exodeoxyribonuclease V alpha subunit
MTRTRDRTPLPLHPRGTLRARFAPVGADDVFRRLGVGARRCDLGDEGLYLAEELVAADRWLGGSDPEALGILVLALMIAQRQGSTRLPLDTQTLRPLVASIVHAAQLADELDVARVVKQIVKLTREPGFDSVIGVGDLRRPLVVEDGCVYTERARAREARVAARIAERIRAPQRRVLTVHDARLSVEQARAAELASTGAFTVVTGGPGTGKTLVASAIVRALLDADVKSDRIALAAPTGKAANRLAEVVARELGDTVAPSAQTLHRLLGYRGDGGFVHHARAPLPLDALIVDEASMIDLELADALLDALPRDAHLVLIGDAQQLPAIDAGRLLADLCAGDAAPTVRARVASLARSFRADAADPRGRAIIEAARAVQSGDASPLERANARTPGTLCFEGVEWVDTKAHDDATHRVVEAAWHHAGGLSLQTRANEIVVRFEAGRVVSEHRAALEQLFVLATRARILTATRALATGSLALNAHLHTLALARASASLRPDFIPGEPVIVTANDYTRGLYNGEQGLIVRADEGSGAHRYRAVFRVGGELVPFAIEPLRDHLELAWALTVHKSQGSELDEVTLVFPDDDLPLLTRELVYTGITRAKHSVVLCGARAIIAGACKRVGLRHSGLAARLHAALD